MMQQPLKIKLNEDQTRKFLSVFVKEAIEIAKRRAREQKQKKLGQNGVLGS